LHVISRKKLREAVQWHRQLRDLDAQLDAFRLITEIFYKDQTVLVRHVLTHEEYDQGAWKK